ncbi:hypothetical protein HPB48_015529 [Haemaphysalis longicornis]|uniref:Uncharacterized protein n=1 Tax=Haemaphysalis longicornis TaxID=44386 RepID=A0A9J6FHR6_HAELO|nr:hypothetical protein HPB48_015529 [Haemaphysalis longicornis]
MILRTSYPGCALPHPQEVNKARRKRRKVDNVEREEVNKADQDSLREQKEGIMPSRKREPRTKSKSRASNGLRCQRKGTNIQRVLALIGRSGDLRRDDLITAEGRSGKSGRWGGIAGPLSKQIRCYPREYEYHAASPYRNNERIMRAK